MVRQKYSNSLPQGGLELYVYLAIIYTLVPQTLSITQSLGSQSSASDASLYHQEQRYLTNGTFTIVLICQKCKSFFHTKETKLITYKTCRIVSNVVCLELEVKCMKYFELCMYMYLRPVIF